MKFDIKDIIRNSTSSTFCLLSVLILGTILRIYNLGAESLWFDEVGSADLAMRPPVTLFFKFHNSPLYFLILKFWMRFWGTSEFALRSLSVVFGIGSIFLIYKVGELLFSRKVGLFSAFLLSISPVHIFYSQETRNYSLSILLTLLSMFIFVKLLKEDRTKLYFYFALVNILLVYTLFHAIWVVIGQNLFFFFKSRRRKRWLITQVVILIFALLWLVPIVTVALKEPWIRVSTSWIPKPHLSALLETFRTFSYGGESYGGADIHIGSNELQIPKNLFYMFGILSFLGLLIQKRPESNMKEFKRHLEAAFLLCLWLFSSILIPFFFSIVFFPVYIIRCVIFALPAFLIFVALGISRIKIRTIQAGIIFTITILTAFTLNIYYTKDLKIPWREAINYVNEKIEKNDVIIVSLAKQVRLFGYYGKNGLKYQKKSRLNIDKSLGSALITGGFVYSGGESKLIGVNNVEQLKQIINSGKVLKKDSNIWLVLTRWAAEIDSAEPIRKYIDGFYQNMQQKHYRGISVYYYKPYKI